MKTLAQKIRQVWHEAFNFDGGETMHIRARCEAVANEADAKDAEIAALRTDGERLIREAAQAKGEVVAAGMLLAEAKDRIEQLESGYLDDAEEFDKDCWRALRSLLNQCGWDWDTDPEVTADDAREHISLTLNDVSKRLAEAEKRAAELEAAAKTDLHDALRLQVATQQRVAALEAALARFVAEARHHYATKASSLAALVEMGESALRGSK